MSSTASLPQARADGNPSRGTIRASGSPAARNGSPSGHGPLDPLGWSKKLRVLLVDSDPDRAAAVQAGLTATGCTVVAISAGTEELTRHVRDTGAEVIVCGLDDPSRDELEGMRALHRDEPRPVVLFAEKAEPEQIEAALAAGVAAYVVEGMAPARVRPVIEIAIRRFRAHQALREELAEARQGLAEQKLVDRAKALLMERHRLTEPEAYRRLRRMAMDQGLRIATVAATVLDIN